MEGWDANRDGSPSEHTLRTLAQLRPQWSQADLGRRGGGRPARWPSQPRQTLATRENLAGLTALVNELRRAHQKQVGSTDDLLVGLQLTHSGRFSRPHDERLQPRIGLSPPPTRR